MSYNGSGTFNINTSGQPVVTGTTITSTAFNLLTADLATGLTTALTKDGQTTPTANIPMGGFKITGLAAGAAATDAAQYGQLQAGATTIATVSGTDALTGTLTLTPSAYATGNLFSFVAANTNTGAATINLNSLGVKSITKSGTTALAAGDIVSGQVYLIEYDGTRFQLINPSTSSPSGILPISNGGTNSTATPTAGAVLYGNGTAYAFTAAGTSGQVLTSGGASAPTWTTPASSLTGVTNSATPFLSALGYQAGNVNTGVNNNFIGYQVGLANTSGNNNTASGFQSLKSNTTGNNNCAFGSSALATSTTASTNSAFGASSLASVSGNAYANSAFGYKALYLVTTGAQNNGIGRESLSNCTTGYGNQGLGYLSGQSITTGYYNVCVGDNNAGTLTTGYGNIIIGQGSDSSSGAVYTETVIGFQVLGKGNNTAFIAGTAYNGANTATWSVTSDARIKKNVINLDNGLSIITALRPVEFDYKENDRHEVGFIAQEYETVLPDQIVKHAANNLEKEMVGGNEVFGIQQNLVPYLVKALQELNAKFDAYVATHP